MTDVDNSLLTADELSPQDDLLSAAEGDTLTKAELANVLYEQVGLNKREAKDVVDAFFNEIRDALVKGDSVKLSGLATFSCATSPSVPAATPRPANPFLFRLGEW